ncbi:MULTISPECIES: hypothetical protein [Acetobacter]|uniref:hypothetical protein n=1 Tax=Acetobacter TaxID=434 RepID=UPI0012E7461B|nr:hypothetical protein [Acetobacter malorum]
MIKIRPILLLSLLCSTVGCASIIDGTSQQITVNTNPQGATCGLYRKNERIGTVEQTPGSVLVKKTKRDIWIECVKDGYDVATYKNHSGVAGASFGNIAAGGLIGVAIDSASGADNKYDGTVNITLPLAKDTTVKHALPTMFDGNVSAQQ